jgi:hypothetical protein
MKKNKNRGVEYDAEAPLKVEPQEIAQGFRYLVPCRRHQGILPRIPYVTFCHQFMPRAALCKHGLNPCIDPSTTCQQGAFAALPNVVSLTNPSHSRLRLGISRKRQNYMPWIPNGTCCVGD